MIKDLEISLDDELLSRSPRIFKDGEAYIPYCTKDKYVCRGSNEKECIYYAELLIKK